MNDLLYIHELHALAARIEAEDGPMGRMDLLKEVTPAQRAGRRTIAVVGRYGHGRIVEDGPSKRLAWVREYAAHIERWTAAWSSHDGPVRSGSFAARRAPPWTADEAAFADGPAVPR